MRKFDGKSNITGNLIEKAILKKNISKESVCQKLQLVGINIDRIHLYRIIKGEVILKDFELLALCKILDIDYDNLINLIKFPNEI